MSSSYSNFRWKVAQAAEIRWWQRYLRKRPKADYLSWKATYWENFLQRTQLSLAPGATALDAGCGPAGIFMILQQQKVDAVDPLINQYEEKLEHFHPKAYPWTRFHNAPLEGYQADEATYDYIFCLNAINHVADLDDCLDRLLRWLRPGGTLLLSIDAHNHQIFKKIFRLLPGDILHPHQYDLEEYRQMLLSRGLSINDSLLFDKGFLFDYYLLVAQKQG